MHFSLKKKEPEKPLEAKKEEQQPGRCPGCPNHCPFNALSCGKGRNLLRQKELMG